MGTDANSELEQLKAKREELERLRAERDALRQLYPAQEAQIQALLRNCVFLERTAIEEAVQKQIPARRPSTAAISSSASTAKNRVGTRFQVDASHDEVTS